MAVATATPEQLAQLHNFVQMQRATTIEWFRVINQIEALILGWNSTILGIIGPPQGTVIHDASSLAGCSELTDTQITNLFGTLQQMHTDYFTANNQAAAVLATGPNNSNVS